MRVNVQAGSAAKLSASVSIPVETCRPVMGQVIQMTFVTASSAFNQGERDVASLSRRLLFSVADDAL